MTPPIETLPKTTQEGDGEYGSPNPNPETRGRFMGDLMGRIRQRADERRENQWRPRENPPPERGGAGGADEFSLRQGSVARMDVPRGFRKGVENDPNSGINTSVHSPDSYRVYRFDRDPNTKLCYWKLDAHAPGEESAAALQRLLTPGPGNPPHRLKQQEIDAISEAIPNALYGYNGNFDVIQLATTNINGKRVLMMETRFKDADRSTIGIFTNPDPKTTSIELVWFESSKAGYRAHANDAWKAINGIQWEAPAQQPKGPQGQLPVPQSGPQRGGYNPYRGR